MASKAWPQRFRSNCFNHRSRANLRRPQCVAFGDADYHAKGTGGLIMFGTMEPWGYGGYGQFHMVIWIILAIAAVAGVVWRLWLLRSGSS